MTTRGTRLDRADVAPTATASACGASGFQKFYGYVKQFTLEPGNQDYIDIRRT
jgi:hypothetical protein